MLGPGLELVFGRNEFLKRNETMASVTPGHAADVGVATKNGDWLELVEQQGDRFLGCAAEDGGRLSDELVDVIDKACAVIGGTRGEQQALVNYWRQRLAVANARGVAKVIKARTPLCTGDHYPLRPHHFSHIQAVPPPLQPRQHLPARAGTCLPCNAPLPTAINVRARAYPATPLCLPQRTVGHCLSHLL